MTATKFIVLTALLLFTAAPLASQTSAQGRATIQIDEVMSLEVRPGGGMAMISADGVYREVESAVELTVLTNRSWQLHVVTTGPDTRVASASGAGAAEQALWWRGGEGTEGEEYRRAERWPVLMATGAGGVTEIDVDYRWLDGPGRELEPGTTLHFMLSAR